MGIVDDPRQSGFWQEHYERGEPPWDKGEAAPPLVRAIEKLNPEAGLRALVPGCGYGHEALLLAERGCEVVAVDFAKSAIDELARPGSGFSLRALERDIFTLATDFAKSFDLVVEHTCFCAIPLDRREEYATTMAAVLGEGGVLLGLFWELGQDGGPPFNTTRADLSRYFDPLFDMVQVERPGDSFPSRQDQEWLVVMTRR